VFQVGLTGGIASGKSTVSRLLAKHGAFVVDADLVAREVVEPGTPALAQIVAVFGDGVLRPDGSLDRDALGAIVFADAEANKKLRAITHPAIGARIAELIDTVRDSDAIVVLDAPLLVEAGWTGMPLIVVAAEPEVQVERMVRDRDMDDGDARSRMAAQASLEDKLAKADIVIWNNGSIAELEARVDEVWAELVERARRAPGPSA